MSSSNYNRLTCNTANYNYFEIGSSGIIINSSKYNTLTDNTFNSNSIGIKLNSSSYNILTNNTFNSNKQTGIDLHYSNYNTLINNTAFLNNLGGILLDSSNHNAITKNTLNSNTLTGIGLHYSNYNTLTKNSACMNNASGILLAYSRHNLIYLNNFINKGDNFLLFGSLYFDTWNSTEEIAYRYNETTYTHHLGNYWSDYKGTDENEDGIGDTPYSLESDKDNHPLMEPLENYLGDQADLVPTPMPEQKTWHFVVFFSGSESGETPSFNITGDEWRVKWIIEPSSTGGLLFTASARRFSPFSEYVGFWTSVASWKWDSGSPYDGVQHIYEGEGSYSFKVSCMFFDNWLLTVEDYY
jgi:parallel beta-helix repeat protein